MYTLKYQDWVIICKGVWRHGRGLKREGYNLLYTSKDHVTAALNTEYLGCNQKPWNLADGL